MPTDLQSARNTRGADGGDTTAAGLPASVRVTGQALGVTATAPVAGNTDTLRYQPLAHARITLKRNILVNGQSAQEIAAELSADGAGRFGFDDLPGGYYVVEAAAPGHRDGWEYLPATRPAAEVTVYLWKR